MKNDDEMYQSVLSKYAEYQEKKKKRIRMLRYTVPVLASFCFAVIIGFGLWNNLEKLPDAPKSPDITDETAEDANTTTVPYTTESSSTNTETMTANQSNITTSSYVNTGLSITTNNTETNQSFPVVTQISSSTLQNHSMQTNTTVTALVSHNNQTNTSAITSKKHIIQTTTTTTLQNQTIQTTSYATTTSPPHEETITETDDNCKLIYPFNTVINLEAYKAMAAEAYMIYNRTETTVTTTKPPITTQTTTDMGEGNGCSQTNMNYYGFSVTPTELTLSVGETCKLNVNFERPVYYEESVVFHSSNGSIAGISANGVVTAISEGTTVISVSAKFNPLKVGLDENANIVRKIEIPITVTSDMTLTSEQQAKLSELRKKERILMGEFVRAEKEVLGEIGKDEARITHKALDSILSDSKNFREIYTALTSMVKYPDFIGGSGVTIIEYWFDEKGEEKIELILEQECIYYYHFKEGDMVYDRNPMHN